MEEGISTRVSNLEKSQVSNDIFLKQVMETNKELSSAIRNFEKTMVCVQLSLQANNRDIASLTRKVENLDKKVNDEADANKIDLRSTMKNSVTEILNLAWKGAIGIGAFCGFYEMFKEPIGKFIGK